MYANMALSCQKSHLSSLEYARCRPNVELHCCQMFCPSLRRRRLHGHRRTHQQSDAHRGARVHGVGEPPPHR